MHIVEKISYPVAAIGGLAAYAFAAHAQMIAPPIDIPCPNDEPCKVLVLTQSELNVLVQDNGILATAAQARNLDLGQIVSYFRQKIALASAGKNAPKVSTEPNANSVPGSPPGAQATGAVTAGGDAGTTIESKTGDIKLRPDEKKPQADKK